MNRFRKVFCSVLSLSVILTGLLFAISIQNNIRALDKKYPRVGIVNNTFKNSLVFRETFELFTPIVTGQIKEKSGNKSLDIYEDADKNLYYFTKDTNSLCGYQKQYYYCIPTEHIISESIALQNADLFLSEVVPEFDEYALIMCEYSECDMVYHMQYSYYTGGVPTDDIINIYEQADGEIGAYMIPNRGAYRNLKVDVNTIRQKALLREEGKNLLNQYITKSGEDLILINNYESVDEQNRKHISQTFITIE